MKILVAIDGSPPSIAALKFAIRLLDRQLENGAIGLVVVRNDASLQRASRLLGRQVITEYLQEQAELDLTEARALLAETDLAHETIVRTGRPETEICACAREGQYDMIAMGSKGRSGIGDLLIGSVAQRVAAMASVPVTLVK